MDVHDEGDHEVPEQEPRDETSQPEELPTAVPVHTDEPS